MIITDIAMLLSFVVFLIAWMTRNVNSRPWVLLGSASTLLASSAWAYHTDRWQVNVAIGVGAVFFLLALIAIFKKNRGTKKTPYVSGVFLLIAATVSMFFILSFPLNPLPVPSGQYQVGVRSFELVDKSRLNVQDAGVSTPRRLLVKVWYPAEEGGPCKRAPYFSPLEARTTARGLGSLFGRPEFLTHLRHIQTNSCKDAAIVSQPDASAARPTLFYSHGYVMFAGQHVTLMEDLASHGYVVYAIQHTRDSSATVFPNGDVVDMDSRILNPSEGAEIDSALDLAYSGESFDDRLTGLLQASEQLLDKKKRFAQSRQIWVEDRLFVHNELAEGRTPRTVSDILGASDFERTGQIGMSFGGSTTGAICLTDTRCAAAVNLDGFDYHLAGINADMPVPFLMLHADTDMFYASSNRKRPASVTSFNDFSYESFSRAGLSETLHRVELRSAFHLGMSDLPLFVRWKVRNDFVGATPAGHFVQAQNRLIRDFFDTYLRGLDVDYPNAALKAHDGWLKSIDTSAIRSWWQAKSDSEKRSLEQAIVSLKSTVN